MKFPSVQRWRRANDQKYVHIEYGKFVEERESERERLKVDREECEGVEMYAAEEIEFCGSLSTCTYEICNHAAIGLTRFSITYIYTEIMGRSWGAWCPLW